MPVAAAQPVFRRRVLLSFWIAVAFLPVLYIAAEFATDSRNFPFWDEIDSALDFLLGLQSGGSWHDVVQRFFALNNEHRTVTSRIIFAISYWLTGTVNFHVIGAIGNLFIVGACGLLIVAARGLEQRIRLGVVLAFLVFQLENYENFIWSGASIDHFQVVMLAIAALVAVTRGTTAGCISGAVLATLATFTLAHGTVVWPIGAAWLAQRREWRRLALWLAAAGVATGIFFGGFEFNPGHNIPHLTPSSLVAIGSFWLELLGSPLALGDRMFAAVPGAALLVLMGVLTFRGAHRRYPVAALAAVFGVLSLVLVAFGRVNMSMDTVTSRYMILSVVAWAMVIHMLLEDAVTEGHPFRWLAWVAPALLGFNITANAAFQPPKEAFIEVRDRAATYFKAHGHVGDGISRMHPSPRHAEEILATAYARGVYHLGRVSDLAEFDAPEPSKRIIAYCDEVITNDRAVTVGGWAMIPGIESKRGQVYLVLQSDDSFLIYSTLTLQRPDVARAYKEPKWRLCGFRAVIGRERLPNRNYRVGVLITEHGKAEYLLTTNVLGLSDRTPRNGQLATAP